MVKKQFLLLLLLLIMPLSLGAQTAPSIETYDQLLSPIREVKFQTQLHYAQHKINEAWSIGALVNEYVEKNKLDPSARKKLVFRIGEDLDLNARQIYNMSAFAAAYEKPPAAGQLTWSHYQELSYIRDPKLRNQITEEAVELGWGREKIRQEAQRRLKGLPPQEEIEWEPVEFMKPGRLYVYRVVKAKHGPMKEKLVLDLGFSTYLHPKEIKGFEKEDYIDVSSGKFVKKGENPADLYNYKIEPIKIIDGDTFTAVVDLGLNLTRVQKFRLEDANAPELNEDGGAEARDYLAARIQNAKTLTVRCQRMDQYGRGLADLFVDGVFIANELIEKGFADPVED